jgi:eukaryotic-like serine/threonine-protein kinase
VEPRAIAHFDVLGELAAGGMGVVYRARDRVLQRDVALKLVRPDRAGDADARQRFLHEARAAAVLNHPGIAAVYEAGEARVEGLGDEPQLYLAEELIEGETLAARVRRGPLPPEDVVRLGIQLGEALGAAHDRGIVHRDVKPSNLMVTADGVLKVLDFGIAKQGGRAADAATTEVTRDASLRTLPGVLVGTPAYMAPEQIVGGPAGPPVDVYASGCVLYEMLTGRPPFPGADVFEVLQRNLADTPPPVAELRPDVPEAVCAVVARALARDPRERYANGRELALALKGIEPGRHTKAARRAPTRRVSRWAAGVLLAATLVVGGWLAQSWLARPALAFKERDFIVVADVVNGTGEPVFDVAIKSALEIGLRQSRYVNVLDSSQTQNALRLLRLAPDARLDVETGRKVCQRAGAKALFVPQILRAGEAYQLQVTVVEPPTGRAVDEVLVTARGREEVLLSSIDKLTRQLRGRLGESLGSIARANPPFAQYTTSSLEALRLLGLGTKARDASDLPRAERFYQEAIQLDPRFSAARASLGLLYIQFLERPDEGRKLLAEALQEAGKVSEREYLHLRALNKQFVTEDPKGALEDYRFISELYPDLMPPYNNSGRILQKLGRFRDAAAMFERAHAKDPRSSVPLWNLWSLSVGGLHDPTGAERVSRMLIELLPTNAFAAHALAWSLIAERRFAEAEEGMRATLKIDPSHANALPNLGHLQFRRGAWTEAIATYREVLKQVKEGRIRTGTEHLELSLGLALAAAGEADEARQTLVEAADRLGARSGKKALPPEDEAMIATMLAGAGRKDAARAMAERAGAHAEGTIDVNYELARAWAVIGDRERAVRYLRGAFAAGYDDPYLIVVDPALAALKDDPAIETLAPRRAEGAS